MLHIGITGGIGSGKTAVCRLFAELGIPIYDADERAKQLMTTNPELVASICAAFGTAAYLPNGNLNRDYLATAVFGKPEALATLNSLVHPAAIADALAWQATQAALGKAPYTLKEAAILIESGSYKGLDKIIVVTAPLDVRIRRVVARDGRDETAVKARIAAQMTDADKLKYADYVITNDIDDLEALAVQVAALHHTLLNMKREEKGGYKSYNDL